MKYPPRCFVIGHVSIVQYYVKGANGSSSSGVAVAAMQILSSATIAILYSKQFVHVIELCSKN